MECMRKSKLLIFVIALTAVAAVNIKTMLSSAHSYDLTLASIETISNSRIGGEGDEDIAGEVDLPEVGITCSTGGSGKCYQKEVTPIQSTGKCHFECVESGNPKDYCSSIWMDVLNWCSSIS